MFSRIRKAWETSIDFRTFFYWLFFVVVFSLGFDFGLPLWSRVLAGIYVATGIIMTLIPEFRKILATKPTIISFVLVGLGLIVYTIVNPNACWSGPALVLGMMTMLFGMMFAVDKIPQLFN
jgi:hypothetical protein